MVALLIAVSQEMAMKFGINSTLFTLNITLDTPIFKCHLIREFNYSLEDLCTPTALV